MRVVFVRDEITVTGEKEDRLLDLCDDAGATVPFSCRDASCGTCLVDIVTGAELLRRPEPTEQILLVRLGARKDQRLACRAVLGADVGDLHVVPADAL